MTACPQTSIFELSVRWWTGNTDWFLECECQSKSVSNSRTTAGAAMWWKMCLYLDSINVLRNANGKINLKEEQKLVVKEMLFGISGLPEMFLLFFRLAIWQEFRKRSGRQIVTACVLVVLPLRDRSI